MKYFYLHPFKPQYFFPEGFERHKLFLSFFKPYSIKGKISWFLFVKFSYYRFLFKKKNIEEFIPEIKIRKIINVDSSIAFNSGTAGPEQKITGLGLQKNGGLFFFKYAQSSAGIKNLLNEHYVLRAIQSLDFVPKIKYFYKDKTQVLLKTNVLFGNRLANIPLNESIINCLLKLSDQFVNLPNKTTNNLKYIFSHGDFCPWNMMEKNQKILLFDWEMAGNYPVGYDLFTYIFQTNFLLKPKRPISEIFLENESFIKMYFDHFKIVNWNKYLLEFIFLKINFETKKGKYGISVFYKNLLNFLNHKKNNN